MALVITAILCAIEYYCSFKIFENMWMPIDDVPLMGNLCTGIYSVDCELSAGCPGRKRVLLPDRLRRCGSKSDLSVVLFIFSNDTGKTGGDRKRILQ